MDDKGKMDIAVTLKSIFNDMCCNCEHHEGDCCTCSKLAFQGEKFILSILPQSRAEGYSAGKLDGAREFADELKKKIAPYNVYKCPDKAHDDRWCPTCEIRTDTLDMVEDFIDELTGGSK